MSDFAATIRAGASDWPVAPRAVFTIARKEVGDALRNRWFILYTIAFVALSLGLSFLSLVGTGATGFAGFGRTAAGLINLVILIVPLMALTAGAASLAAERERGSLAYLLAQPVSRLEVLLGKYLGLAAALFASIALGFGASAAVIAWKSGTDDALNFARLVGLAYALGLAMLSVGMLVSTIARRASSANGAAIFLWLTFVFLGDLGLMGSAMIFKLHVTDLFRLSLLNPMQVFKMASLESVHASLDVLGPAGLYAMQAWGNQLSLLLGGVLAAWIIAPLGLSAAIFIRRGGS
ncbi:MAG: ABC transporter permease subunit [Phycisphaeraceae bacterium]|nr:ABC transporter permease [Phycisphaerales bacterium]QOJ17638.1 MAG: ABC transporter permease subunit [Phycisphaeraceae bacterium]